MQISFLVLFAALVCFASADLFNITTCFCHDANDKNTVKTKYTETGTYYKFDYWNAHLNKVYSFDVTRRVEGVIEHLGEKQGEAMPKLPRTCHIFEDQAELCYWRKSPQLRGRFRFNGRKKILEHGGLVDNTYKQKAIDLCSDYCVTLVGLPTVDKDLTNYMSYSEKDMCTHDAVGYCRIQS